MFPQQTAELTNLQSQLVDGMEDYRKACGAECGYNQQEIRACFDIIDAYLIAVDGYSEEADSDKIMGEVQRAVLDLNKLNERCNGSLIETDQREQICEIITKAAQYAGLKSDTGDITEEWREW